MRVDPWLILLVCVSLLGAQQQQAPGGEYAGSEMCQACHEDIHKQFAGNRHSVLETSAAKGWEGRACEACHGPGGKHAESVAAADIRQPVKQSAKAADATCLSCHRNQSTHSGRIQGGHARSEIPCTSCHSVHKPHRASRTKEEINKECSSCHVSVWAEFQKPHRHPVREAAMSCLDCHNPHGKTLAAPARLRVNEPGCLTCHGDKRGPFAFEHAPMRLEGCSACHQPHGSANPRMLTRHEVRFQCLECHSGVGTERPTLGGIPPAFHDLRSARFRNCTACHVKVHGSHVNRSLLR